MTFLATPNRADFVVFLRNVVQIPAAYLPDNSLSIDYALGVALGLVNTTLTLVPGIYPLAVYNLGADNVINFAPDVGVVDANGNTKNYTFFDDIRTKLNIELFVPGVVLSSGDSGTSASRATPEFMKTFTMANLQNLKTPYGRQYLAFAQAYGTLWGLT